MKSAMIFAAGLGTRLKPLTDTMPKALVPYNGVPMLEGVISTLKDAGFDNFVVNVHHFADMVEEFISDHNSFGVKVRTSSERDLLRDTGGGIRHAAELLEGCGPVLVHNVDIITNLDYSDIMSHHFDSDLATLVVSERKTSRYLLFDSSDRLVGWTNISTGEVRTPYENLDVKACRMYAFAGIHIISPAIFELMASWPEKFSIMDFYLKVCKSYPVRAFIVNGLEVNDLGKIEIFQKNC